MFVKSGPCVFRSRKVGYGNLSIHVGAQPLGISRPEVPADKLRFFISRTLSGMNKLNAFGLFAVTAMVVCYALEHRHHSFILTFAFSCILGSVYGFLQGAWPFGLVELIWSGIAVRKWLAVRRRRA